MQQGQSIVQSDVQGDTTHASNRTVLTCGACNRHHWLGDAVPAAPNEKEKRSAAKERRQTITRKKRKKGAPSAVACVPYSRRNHACAWVTQSPHTARGIRHHKTPTAQPPPSLPPRPDHVASPKQAAAAHRGAQHGKPSALIVQCGQSRPARQDARGHVRTHILVSVQEG